MNAEELFTRYRELKAELKMVTYQIAHFKGISESELIDALAFGHNPDEVRVSGSGTSDKTAKIALNLQDIMKRENTEWYDYLVKRYRELDDEVSFFEFCIRQLGDKKYYVVMDLLDGELTYDDIASHYKIGRTTVVTYRKEAISMVEKMLKRREEEQVAFMLS